MRSRIFDKIDRKTPASESLFNKVGECRPANLLTRYSETSVYI